MIHTRLTNVTISLAELEDLHLANQKRTLGNLLKDFRKYVRLEESTDAIMADALEKRNFLIHRYFWERAAYILTPGGRDKMIDELIDIENVFICADAAADAVTRAGAKVLGVTDELIAEEFTKFRDDAKVHDI